MVTEHYQKEMDRARNQVAWPPADYERTAREFKRLLDKDAELIEEFRMVGTSENVQGRRGRFWPKWLAFLILGLIAVFFFLLFGCSTALLIRTGETCTYMTDKGVLISRPCARKQTYDGCAF